MKKLLSVMAVLLMAAVVAFPPAAQAIIVPTATLYLDDNAGATLTILDQTPILDSNPLPGVVTYIGALGPNWWLNVTTGVSNSPGVGGLARMDLNSVNQSLAAGTLTLMFNDINFANAGVNSSASMAVGGTTPAIGGAVTYSAYFDNTNAFSIPPNPFPPPFPNATATLIGTLGPFGGPAFSGTFNGNINTVNPYSLTEVVTIKHAAAGGSSLDAELKVVPLPPTALLLGGGLLGLVALGWRRRRS